MPSQDYSASCGDAENLRVFCEVGDVRLSEVGEIQRLAEEDCRLESLN